MGLAQDLPRAEVFGGYSYLNADFNGLIPRKSANGWEASVSVNFDKRLAAEADVSGYYTTISNVGAHTYGLVGGPRLNIRPVFLHALFGVDRGTLSAFGTSASQNSFAAAVGGGGQWAVSPHLAVRVSADDAFTRHNIFGGPRVTQVNIRVSAGLVFMFGATEASRKQTQTAPGGAVRATGMPIASLGVMATTWGNGGAEIVEVAPGSVAQLAGLRVGDVINAVEGKPVRSAMELAAEFSSRAVGEKIRLGYMVRGTWQTETVVILQQNR